MGTSQEQPFLPRTRAPCVWVEPSPRLLRRITRNSLLPPSVPTAGALTPTALSAISQEALGPMWPPHSSLTLHSVPQVSSPRPVDNPPTGAPAQGSAGPGIVSSGCWWQRHSELLQSSQPPPPGTAAVAAARSLASLPASISPAWVLPPAASVVARLPWSFPSAGEEKKAIKGPKETAHHHQPKWL